MTLHRRKFWQYWMFQISLCCFIVFLLLSLLGLLNFGTPNVAVAIVLDLSSSTYRDQSFNSPGSIMSQEIAAVNSYLEENTKLRTPNKVKIFGFRSNQVPDLTNSFEADIKKVKIELEQGMQTVALHLAQKDEPNRDDLNAPIQHGIKSLSNISDHCRELLLVSDAAVDLNPESLISEASKHHVKINAIGFDGYVPELEQVASATKGLYLVGKAHDFTSFFSQRFFRRFNNFRWTVLWLGATWISLMWFLTLPLDQLILQNLIKLHWSNAGRLAIGHALFWSILTPLIVWQFWRVLGLPSFSSC